MTKYIEQRRIINKCLFKIISLSMKIFKLSFYVYGNKAEDICCLSEIRFDVALFLATFCFSRLGKIRDKNHKNAHKKKQFVQMRTIMRHNGLS